MADVIAKLQVDSGQFDQRLKSAIEQMTKMEKEVRRTGATFAYADKEEIAFIESLGSMETRATSAKQKMLEYTNAITSMVAMYRQMNDEEKNSDTGKALSASIDQLKAKAAQLKDVMSDTNIELKNLASDTSFTDGIGLMTRTVGSCAAAITAWTGDSKEMEAVIKDLAKIGTTVAAVDQLTKAFQKQNLVLLKNPYVAAAAAVVALGVAIGKIIKSTTELSETQKALNEVQQKGMENSAQEVTRIETLNNILHDNTRSLEERKTALNEIQSLVPDYHGALTDEGELINDNADKIRLYVTELQRAATAQAAFDQMVELQKKKMEEQVKLQKAQAELEKQQAAASQPISKDQMMAQAGMGRNVYGSVANTNKTLVDAAQGEVNKIQKVIDEQDAKINALRDLVKSNDIGTSTGTGTKTKPSGGGRKVSGGSSSPVRVNVEPVIPEGSAAALRKQISELQNQWDMATTQDKRNSINAQIEEAQKALDAMSPQVEQVAEVIKDAAYMWGEHTEQIEEIKMRLAEFQAMMGDMSLSAEQRDWAAGMADSYQEQLDKMTGKTSAVNITFTEQGISELGKQIKDKMGGLEFGSGDYLIAASNLVDFTSFENLLRTALESGMSLDDVALREQFEKIKMGVDVPDEEWQTLVDSINTQLKDLGLDPIQLDVKTGNVKELDNQIGSLETNLNGAISVFGQLGDAMQQIDDPGAKVAGIIMGAIANIAGTFAKSLGGTFTPWDWIAAAISGTATMISTIAAIKSATSGAGHYANGGIVPGNSLSGDNVPAMLNSQEVVLNRAQTSNLASQLNSNPMGNLRLSTEISGSNLRVVLNNDNRQRGGSRDVYGVH